MPWDRVERLPWGTPARIADSVLLGETVLKIFVTGLARSAEAARELEQRSIRPVIGTLDDADVVVAAVRAADAVINAAEANHPDAVRTICSALAGSGKAPAGALYYAENGENTLKDTAAAISRMLGFGGKTRAWSPEDAEAAIGFKAHSSFGSNSRVRGKRSRAELGWQPQGVSMLQDIEHGWYRRVHRS